MSLQVWLPLNGNLNNQGLADVTIINSGATVNSAGKIGQCYSLSSGNYIGFDGASVNNFKIATNLSIGCWIYFTSTDSSERYIINCYEGGGFGLCWQNQKINWQIYANSGYRACWSSSTLSLNVWHHVVGTYDDRYLKLYIDGILSNTLDLGSTYDITYNSTTPVEIGGNPGPGSFASGNLTAKLNDLRIYDNCLSPKEVEELAKGLVLHYKLDDPYVENTTNLGATSATYSNKTYGTEYSLSGWGGDAGTVTFYSAGGYANYPYKVYHKTATGSGCVYYKTDNDIVLEANKTYTMSVYIKASVAFTDSAYNFNINRGSDNYYINFGSAPNITTEWQRFTKTFTTSSAEAGSYGEKSIIYYDGVTDYYVYFSGFQIEANDHATPFTPDTNSSSTIYDSSGYGYNGTKNGAIIWKNDTPRYNGSYYLSDSDSSITLGDLSTYVPEGIFTFNIWFYKTTGEWGDSWDTIFGGPGGFELEGRMSSSTAYYYIHPYSWGGGSVSTPNAYSFEYQPDQWNMLTMVRTTSDTKFYLNGELKVTGTAGSIPSGNYFFGAWKSATQQNFKGKLSDARIYATALTDTQIRELYNTSASIANNGTLLVREVVEE